MAFQKNDEVRVLITDLTEDGEGVGRADGFPIFVKDALIGDEVRAKIIKDKKTYAYGRLMEVLTPSPERVPAACPAARACGGCQIQEMDYAAQLRFKRKRVQDHLERLGGLEGVCAEETLGMEEPWQYRGKTQVPVQQGPDGRIRMGFYAGHTHAVVETEDCLIGPPENRTILDLVRAHMEKHRIPAYSEKSGIGLVRHVLIRKGFFTGQILVCLVLNGDRIPREEELADRLWTVPGMTSFCVNVNRARTNVILGEKVRTVRGTSSIEEVLDGVRFEISPLSFFQVNPVQTEKLYALAVEAAGLTGKETVWDIYCGAGTISLFLARRAARVFGNEIVEAAVENARKNAERNGIENARFFTGRAEEVLPRLYAEDPETYRADVVVVDPPRKGCDSAVLETVLRMAPERIVYVSCNSATLARDARILCAGGYRIASVRPVDMFPHTCHVETVVQLSKGNISSQNVRVEFSLEDMDMSGFQQGATYEQIQEWIQEKYGFHVTHLNIAKTKRKCGIIERQNYNLAKSENSRSPDTPKEKEEAIIDAFLYFKMM